MASKIVKAMATILLVAGGSAAAAQSARTPGTAATPVAQRAGESTEGHNSLEGTTAWILAAISIGLIIWGIIEFTSDQKNSNSP